MGANAPGCRSTLEAAFSRLATLGKVHRSTPLYPTDPEFAGDVAPYLNRIIELDLELSYDALHTLTKDYERGVRLSAACEPHVALDIDIVKWNDEVLRPADARARYFCKGMALLDA